MAATSLPPAAETTPAAGEHPNYTAVLDAARVLAGRYQITPRWRERLTPEAVALVNAVLEHDRGGRQ